MDREKLLRENTLLDIEHPSIQGLIRERGWTALADRERVGAFYDFVRNEIAFGYNLADDLPASRVLADGIGQCNTKVWPPTRICRVSAGVKMHFLPAPYSSKDSL